MHNNPWYDIFIVGHNLSQKHFKIWQLCLRCKSLIWCNCILLFLDFTVMHVPFYDLWFLKFDPYFFLKLMFFFPLLIGNKLNREILNFTLLIDDKYSVSFYECSACQFWHAQYPCGLCACQIGMHNNPWYVIFILGHTPSQKHCKIW